MPSTTVPVSAGTTRERGSWTAVCAVAVAPNTQEVRTRPAGHHGQGREVLLLARDPLHTCTSGLGGPGALGCSRPWFPAPTACSPRVCRPGQLSSAHPPAAAVKQRKRGGCPAEKCRQFLARLQQREGLQPGSGREPLPEAGAAQNRCPQLRDRVLMKKSLT